MNKKAFGEYKYTVYKVTNKLNGHIYIGVHKTTDVNDLYYGSGSVICKAIKKYGKENFSKEILFIFNIQKEAYKKENEIVDEDFVKRIDTYNAHIGGKGGWDFVNKDLNQRKIRSKKFDEYLEEKVRKIEKKEKNLNLNTNVIRYIVNYAERKFRLIHIKENIAVEDVHAKQRVC